MTTVVPESEAVRRAMKWIFHERESRPGVPRQDLVQEAVLRFDLSPLEAEFLLRFYREAAEEEARRVSPHS